VGSNSDWIEVAHTYAFTHSHEHILKMFSCWFKTYRWWNR